MTLSVEWADAVNQGTVVGDFWGSRGIRPGDLAGSSHVAGSSGLFGTSTSESVLEFAGAQPAQPPSVGLFGASGAGNSGLGGGNSGSGGGGSGIGSLGSGSGGRSAFMPGDRTWWKLPSLPDPGTEDACIVVSDWLTQIQPIMSDLSEQSGASWKRVMEVAQSAYLRWQQAGPLEKSLIVCETPSDLVDPRLSRFRSQGFGYDHGKSSWTYQG